MNKPSGRRSISHDGQTGKNTPVLSRSHSPSKTGVVYSVSSSPSESRGRSLLPGGIHSKSSFNSASHTGSPSPVRGHLDINPDGLPGVKPVTSLTSDSPNKPVAPVKATTPLVDQNGSYDDPPPTSASLIAQVMLSARSSGVPLSLASFAESLPAIKAATSTESRGPLLASVFSESCCLTMSKTGSNPNIHRGHFAALCRAFPSFHAARYTHTVAGGCLRLTFHSTQDATRAFASLPPSPNGRPTVEISLSAKTKHSVVISWADPVSHGCKVTFGNLPSSWLEPSDGHELLREHFYNTIRLPGEDCTVLHTTPYRIPGTSTLEAKVAVMFSAPPLRLLLQDKLSPKDGRETRFLSMDPLDPSLDIWYKWDHIDKTCSHCGHRGHTAPSCPLAGLNLADDLTGIKHVNHRKVPAPTPTAHPLAAKPATPLSPPIIHPATAVVKEVTSYASSVTPPRAHSSLVLPPLNLPVGVPAEALASFPIATKAAITAVDWPLMPSDAPPGPLTQIATFALEAAKVPNSPLLPAVTGFLESCHVDYSDIAAKPVTSAVSEVVGLMQESFQDFRGCPPVSEDIPYSRLLLAVHNSLTSVIVDLAKSAPAATKAAATWASAPLSVTTATSSGPTPLPPGTKKSKATPPARGGSSKSRIRSSSSSATTGKGRKGRLYQ